MTAENPADAVIEAAARAITAALADAGLLADPADRDEPDWQAIADQAEQDMAHWVRECGDAERRAERAEAEVVELRATIDRVRGLADKWERWGHDGVPIRPSTAAGYLRAALDGAGESK